MGRYRDAMEQELLLQATPTAREAYPGSPRSCNATPPPACPPRPARVVRDLIACRTPLLGGRREACDHCGDVREIYDSCGNRHCPNCQALAQQRWLQWRTYAKAPFAGREQVLRYLGRYPPHCHLQHPYPGAPERPR
jgi:hypothetical protein